MRKVVLYMLTSVDGVVESPDRYVLEFDEKMRDNLARVLRSQDAVLLGRRSYEDWAGYWPGQTEEPFAPFINNVQKYVLTSRPLQAPWGPTTVVDRPVADLVADLKSQPGGEIGVHGSRELARGMLEQGLVDELRLVVAPTVADAGRGLFGDTGGRRRLELIDAESTPSGALLLGYRLVGPV